MCNIKKACSLIILLCCFVLPASTFAQEYYYDDRYHRGYWIGEPGSGEAMIVDALVARPIGLITTVAGSAVYAISLPFSLFGGNEENAREKLVKEPARYTFKRPLGEF